PSDGTAGLSNAMATITSTNLVDVTTGLAPSSFATGVSSPTSKLYTLANILAECVNQSVPSTTACQRLFCDATPGATWNTGSSSCSITPTVADPGAAGLSTARNPANNVSDLFLIPSTFVPFSPTLSSAPTDWLLAVAFDAIGGLSAPTGVAVDSSG